MFGHIIFVACNSLLAAEVSVDFEDELEVPTTDSDNEASSASTEAVKSEGKLHAM